MTNSVEVTQETTTVEVDSSQTAVEITSTPNSVTVQTPIVEIVSVGIQGPEGAPGINTESLELTANEDIGGHRAVVIKGSGVSYANNDELSDLGKVLGVSKNAATTGDLVEVVFAGVIEESSWNFNIGPVYVGQDGMLTQTPLSSGFSQEIGVALSATQLLVHPKTTFKLI